jgi:tetratricopeptide (TPR) repeat protein
VRTFFLFALLTWLLGSPILAGLVLLAIFGGGYLLYSRRLFRWRRRWRARGEARQLEATLAINPEDAKAHSDLGGLLARRGRFAEALPHLEKAIARCDDVPDTNFYLGWALLNQGDLERGRQSIEAALAINPRFGFGEPNLRLGDYFFGRKGYKEAIPHYEASREVHSSGMEAATKLGESYLAIGEKEKAATILQEAVTIYRTLPWFRKQEERGWARKAKVALRRARRAASSSHVAAGASR